MSWGAPGFGLTTRVGVAQVKVVVYAAQRIVKITADADVAGGDAQDEIKNDNTNSAALHDGARPTYGTMPIVRTSFLPAQSLVMAKTAINLPQRHKLTVTDYYQLGEAGSFAGDARVELIEGEIIDMAPIGTEHASVVDHLIDLFTRAVRQHAQVRVQNPARLGIFSEPQPDLMLLKRRADYYRTGHPGPADVLLVVEVADTSLVYDRDTKIPLYARHGIPEAWLIDVKGERLTIYRQPGPDGYELVAGPAPPGQTTILAPDITLDLRELF